MIAAGRLGTLRSGQKKRALRAPPRAHFRVQPSALTHSDAVLLECVRVMPFSSSAANDGKRLLAGERLLRGLISALGPEGPMLLPPTALLAPR